MFKKIVLTSIAAALFSIPVLAKDHHHAKVAEKAAEKAAEKVAEKLNEVKKEKSGLTKLVNGSLQFVNKTAPYLAAIIGGLVYWNGPLFVTKHEYRQANADQLRNAAIFQAAIAGGGSWLVLKYGSAAAMSQEDIKPLAK